MGDGRFGFNVVLSIVQVRCAVLGGHDAECGVKFHFWGGRAGAGFEGPHGLHRRFLTEVNRNSLSTNFASIPQSVGRSTHAVAQQRLQFPIWPELCVGSSLICVQGPDCPCKGCSGSVLGFGVLGFFLPGPTRVCSHDPIFASAYEDFKHSFHNA